MAKIIAVNAGSSSLKFQLFEMDDESVIPDNGLVQDALYKVIDIEYNMEDMPYRDEI